MNQYCFDIKNPDNFQIVPDDIKNFVRKLYIGKDLPKYPNKDDLPFLVLYGTTSENNVCIQMTSKAKKHVERIEKINDSLKGSKLMYKNSVSLSKPYKYELDTQAWWGGGNLNIGGKRWNTLKHRGPYFTHLMEPYKPLKASLIYEGKKYPLNPREEQVATYYAKRKISEAAGGVVDEWTKDKTFNQNFWNDFRGYLTPEHKAVLKDFSKIRWTDVINKIEASKPSELTKEEKMEKRMINEEKKKTYGFAYLDGVKEKLGNFTVEQAAILYGRGDNPLRGKVKKHVNPEDVTINIGENDPVPKPPSGHKWAAIVHEHDSVWVAKWKDSISGENKYVQFSAEGKFKGESDLIKYEKARKLQKHIETVREKYMVDAASNNGVKRQLGTVLWLIDNHGVRVGGEKSADEADTVGASTLRVEHVKLEEPDIVIFDFLGKDSIRFYKRIKVPKLIYTNFEKLLANKKGSSQVFSSINSAAINDYLKEFDKDFTAKVFRTRLASSIIFEALKSVKVPEGATKAETKKYFNKANAKVAEILNHTRNVSKKAQESVKKEEEKLKEYKKELKQLEKSGKPTAGLEKKIESAKNRIEAKTDVLKVAISTSLTNYIDPRIVIAWSKKTGADLTAIYTDALMKKFKWALETTDKKWNWLTSPLQGNQDLEPSENHGNTVNNIKPEKPINYHKSRSVKKPTDDKPKRPGKGKLSNKIFIQQPKNIADVKVGSLKDWKLLVNLCENPEMYKTQIYKVDKEVLEWIYPFSQYFIEKGSEVQANNYIVEFYKLAFER